MPTAPVQTSERRRPRRAEQAADRAPADLLERLPPSSIDAEKCVLGSILLLPEVIDEVVPILRPTMFYDGAHQMIYDAMLLLHHENRPCELPLLQERLQRLPGSGAGTAWDWVGGTAYFAALVELVPHAASAVHYAEIIRDKALKRNLIYAATDVLKKAYDEAQDAADLVSFAEGRIGAVHAEQSTSSVRSICDTLVGIKRERTRQAAAGEAPPRITTGFHELDAVTRVRPGQLVVIGGRPGHGKSTLALDVVRHVCKRGLGQVLFVSLEMSEEELCDKIASAESGIPLDEVVDQTALADVDRQKLVDTARRIGEWDLWLDTSRRTRASDVLAIARQVQRKYGPLALVAVDYLGLLEPEESDTRGFTTRNDEMSRMTRILKQGALELRLPIFCLAQLSRTNEKTGERPKLHHLRDCGAIEQDADQVWFVYRPHYAEEAERDKSQASSRDTFAEIIVAKQRIGGTHLVKLKWEGQVSRFRDFGAEAQGSFRYEDGEF